MGKIPEFADGGSFSRRTSSFINAPKFQPSLPDVPDVKGLDLLAKQPRASTAKKTTTSGKIVDFKLPHIKGRPGRIEWIQNEFQNNVKEYQSYGTKQGPEWFYTPQAQMWGQNIINDMLQWKVKAEAEAVTSKTSFDNSKDSHDDVWLDPFNLYFKGRRKIEVPTGQYDANGEVITETKLNDKIERIPMWDYYENTDLYGLPLTYAENYSNVHHNVTNAPFEKNLPVTTSPASMEKAQAYFRRVMEAASAKGIGNSQYKLLSEVDQSELVSENKEGDMFELVREKTKDNWSNLEAAKELLRDAPEKYKAAFIRDWAVKLNNGSFSGSQGDFYKSLLIDTGKSLRDRTKSITDSKVDGSGLGGNAPGYWYQAINGNLIKSDVPDREETFWVDDPTALDGKKAKQDMKIWELPTHPKMKPFNNLNDLESGMAMASDRFTSEAWVMGTKVDFSADKVNGVFKDPNIITGIDYMVDPEGNETLFKDILLFVDGDRLNGEDFRLLIPTHTVNADGTPANEAQLEGVFKDWAARDNLTDSFKDKGTLGRIIGDQATMIANRVGLGNLDEIYYVHAKVRMTLQEVMGLELDGLKSRQEVEARFFRDALQRQKDAKKTKNALLNATDEEKEASKNNTGVQPIVKDPNDL
jgi:hypothetical protein